MSVRRGDGTVNDPTRPSAAVDIAFALLAFTAVYSGWRMFRTDSMVRA